MDKVYCGKCKWFVSVKGCHPQKEKIFDECSHSANMRIITYSSYRRIREETKQVRYPFKVNHGNDCPNYEPKLSRWQRLLGITGHGVPSMKNPPPPPHGCNPKPTTPKPDIVPPSQKAKNATT